MTKGKHVSKEQNRTQNGALRDLTSVNGRLRAVSSPLIKPVYQLSVSCESGRKRFSSSSSPLLVSLYVSGPVPSKYRRTVMKASDRDQGVVKTGVSHHPASRVMTCRCSLCFQLRQMKQKYFKSLTTLVVNSQHASVQHMFTVSLSQIRKVGQNLSWWIICRRRVDLNS